MKIYYGFPTFEKPSVVVVGSFDGVHRGHRRLIADLNDQADRVGCRAVVVTFDPHPRQVLRGENRLLSTIEERIVLFEQAGVRNLVIVEFTKEFAAIDADCFVAKYLKERLKAVIVFTGQGHTFGRNRGGDDEVLQKYGLEVCHIARYEGISSTEVRAVVENGDMELAAKLLGEDYLIITPVVEPTKLLPRRGCYYCQIDGQTDYFSIPQIRAIEKKSILLIKKRV